MGSYMNQLKEFYNNNRLPVRFVIFFFLFIICAHLIIFVLQITQFLETINALTAGLTRLTLNVFGVGIVQNNEYIYWGDFSLKIIAECTGLFLYIVYLGAVFSYPTSFKNKLFGLLGLPLLILLNDLRLVILMIVGRYYINAFDFIHHYLWQTTFIIAVIAVWIVWLELVVRAEK